MRWWRVLGCVAGLCVLAGVSSLLSAAPASAQQASGKVSIAGRSLKCGSMRNVLDSRLPNIGMAAPGVVVLNPYLLGRQPPVVRLFVFHHECGHHHVGGDELGADCWAAKQGVRQGWLGRGGIDKVCRSFGNGPATATHPAGADRCVSLRRCYAEATGASAGTARAGTKGAPAAFLPTPPRHGRNGLTRSPN